jgi:proteasome accessory factor B
VEPLALVQHQGRWHLFATDQSTSTTKTFLLRRIVTQVSVLAATFEPPSPGQADLALFELEAVWNSNSAIVLVDDGTDAATRLGKRRGATEPEPGTLSLHYSDLNIFADELAGYGPEALVVSPPELREAVRSRLERTAADHG